MCPHRLVSLCKDPNLYIGRGFTGRKTIAGALFIFVFSLVLSAAFALNTSEDYLNVKNWTAPVDAVDFKVLTEKDGLILQGTSPFTGVSLEYYPGGKLLRSVAYQGGKQSGLMLLWYPDGSPQMSATYKDGALHGRFLGWYQTGSIIYDMMINRGAYAGDSILDGDESRASSDTIESEGEGSDNDNSPE